MLMNTAKRVLPLGIEFLDYPPKMRPLEIDLTATTVTMS